MASQATGAFKNLLNKTHAYYHPLMRQGSVTPLWHMMFAVSAIMYTTSYSAHNYSVIQHKHAVEKEAMNEYWEKRGGEPDHH